MTTATKKRKFSSEMEKLGTMRRAAKGAGLTAAVPLNAEARDALYTKQMAELPRERARILLKQIADDGHNHRLGAQDVSPAVRKVREARIQDMADSMTASGQLQPILVYRGVDGKYHRVFGSRRCAAATLLKKTHIDADVLAFIPTDAQIQQMRAIENLQREELSPAEEALAAWELVDAHARGGIAGGRDVAIERAADDLGRPVSWVKDRCYIVEKLTKKTREFLAAGVVNLNQARELAAVGGEKQEKFAQDIADELAPPKSVYSANAGRGGRVVSVIEIKGWIANAEKSLRGTPWQLNVIMRPGVAGGELDAGGKPCGCDRCIHNTSNERVLFDLGKSDEGGTCRLPECFEAKQRMTAKEQNKAVAKIAAQIKSKKIDKEEAGSAAVVREAVADFVKEGAVQKKVKQELGGGEGKKTEPKEKPKTDRQVRQEALLKFGRAYQDWAQSTHSKLEKHVAEDAWQRLAWVAMVACGPAFPEFKYPTSDWAAEQTDGKPIEEKPILPAAAKLLAVVEACATGNGKMDAWQELADEVQLGAHRSISLSSYGPEMIARLCKTFRFEGVTPAPVYESFLPKNHSWKAGDYAIWKNSGATVKLGSLHSGRREIFFAGATGSGWADDAELMAASAEQIKEYGELSKAQK